MRDQVDILIIGGGIAGVSLAARLAPHAGVAVLEAEAHLGSQATGRSAALLVEAYGPPQIRTLTGLSRAFFEAPPEGFADALLSRRRGGLVYGTADQIDLLRAEFEVARASANVIWLDADGVLEACPLLRPGTAAAGFLEPDALDLDTAELLTGFAKIARLHGGTIHLDTPVTRVELADGEWIVTAGEMQLRCAVLVNAAGAWADPVAWLAGVKPIGLQPMRRTAATIDVPAELGGLLPNGPFVAPVDGSYYFKPEAAAIMVSLSDETPSEPCDAWPEDLDVAVALDRFHAATIVPPVRPTATWAGLRTFTSDRLPAIGFAAGGESFFWCAGQGGYGIQTSPALSQLAAKLIIGGDLSDVEEDLATALSPRRFARGP